MMETAELNAQVEAFLEAGRVLSAKNEQRLRAAMKELESCLSELSKPEPEQTGEYDAMLTPEAFREESEDGAELLRESAGKSQTRLMKLIAPGWGTSGYYSPDVLKATGPAAFPKGTFGLWDHMTEADKQERPEGRLDALASVTVEDARYLEAGPRGPGLYATAKVFSDYADKVSEKGPHIGLSINAYGVRKPGRVGDREGMIVERLVPNGENTVDFVTRPGAGGQVVLSESAKPTTTASDPGLAPVTEPLEEALAMPMDDREAEALRESVGNLTAKYEDLASKFGTLQTENTQLRQREQLREAKDFAMKRLRKVEGLPALLHERIAESVAGDPPLKDGAVNTAVLEPLVEAAARKEMAILSQLGLAGGKVTGLGGSAADEATDLAKIQASLQESFRGLGLSESGAKLAVQGRG